MQKGRTCFLRKNTVLYSLILSLCISNASFSQDFSTVVLATERSLKKASRQLDGDLELIAPFASTWDTEVAVQFQHPNSKAFRKNLDARISFGEHRPKELLRNNDAAIKFLSNPAVQADFGLIYDQLAANDLAIASTPKEKAFTYWSIGKLIAAGEDAHKSTHWKYKEGNDVPVDEFCLWIIIPCAPELEHPEE